MKKIPLVVAYRSGYTVSMRDELKRLKKAVRDKCLECSGGAAAEVALCEIEDCPLFPFRVELWPTLFGEAGSDAKTWEQQETSDSAHDDRCQFTLL